MKEKAGLIVTLLIFVLVGFNLSFVLDLIFIPFYLLKLTSVESVFNQFWYGWLLGFGTIFIVILCLVLGYKSRKNKGGFYQLFKPTLFKIIFDFVFTLIYLLLTYFLVGLGISIIINSQTNAPTNPFNYPFSFLRYAVTFFIVFYPFSAIVISFFNLNLLKKSSKITLLVLFLFLLNPIVLGWGEGLRGNYIFYHANRSGDLIKCGVQIVSVGDKGPVGNVGLKKLEIIQKIDNKDVKTTADLINYLDEISFPKMVTIETRANTYSSKDTKTYTILVSKDEKSGKFRMGIEVQQTYCNQEPLFDFSNLQNSNNLNLLKKNF